MRKITFSEGEFYHLYNRGVDKRVVFTSPGEYRRFQAYLFLLNDQNTSRVNEMFRNANMKLLKAKPCDFLTAEMRRVERDPLVAIGAYCLMPNHFHIYATPCVENGISQFMQRLQTAYTMFFNEKHERSGALFQGTFKAQHVSNDTYARYLFSYIHLNPTKLIDPAWKDLGRNGFRIVRKKVSEYPYSSLLEYQSGTYVLTDPSLFPAHLTEIRAVDEYVNFWLELKSHFLPTNHKAKP